MKEDSGGGVIVAQIKSPCFLGEGLVLFAMSSCGLRIPIPRTENNLFSHLLSQSGENSQMVSFRKGMSDADAKKRVQIFGTITQCSLRQGPLEEGDARSKFHEGPCTRLLPVRTDQRAAGVSTGTSTGVSGTTGVSGVVGSSNMGVWGKSLECSLLSGSLLESCLTEPSAYGLRNHLVSVGELFVHFVGAGLDGDEDLTLCVEGELFLCRVHEVSETQQSGG